METTINIDINVLGRITDAAHRLKKSRSELIVVLLNKVINNLSKDSPVGKMVQYQQRKEHSDWHRFHIQLQDNEYEYFLDLRKVMKMSVSLVLAYAVENFLDRILYNCNTDNYRLLNYMITREDSKGVIIWKLHWYKEAILENY